MALNDELRRLVKRMQQDVDAVVVEGPRDREALRSAGFEKPVRLCVTADGLVAFARSISEDRVAILTDFDTEGKKLNGRLRDLLAGKRVCTIWRKEFGKLLTERGRRDIESLNNLFAEEGIDDSAL